MPEGQTTEDKLNELRERRAISEAGGGFSKIESQHKRGKQTARERISMMLDEGTFQELDTFVTAQANEFQENGQDFHPGDAVVTGYGNVNGRLTFVYSQDFTVLGGSLSSAVANKICKVMDLAASSGAPIVGLIDSGGARIQEGVDSLSGYSNIFLRNVRSSGIIPQISVVMGPAAGGATYSPALTDFIAMVKGTGQMYITGPEVIKAVTGEQVSMEDLGGADIHTQKSGVAHLAYDSEETCLAEIRRLLGFLPQNNLEEPPSSENNINDLNPLPELANILPDDPNQSYDMLDIIKLVVDNEDFMEIHEDFAPNIIVGFCKIGGKSVGIVANQPNQFAGILDIDSSSKAARFVRFCDAFNIPVVTFIDVPGFMPGTAQEYGGIIRHGAKLIYAYAEATVPKISVLVRKAYGGAYIVMSSKNLNGDVNLSWPTGEVAVMGAEGAVNIIHRNQIKQSSNPDELREQLVSEYQDHLMNPYVAASRGIIDDVIDPAETRTKIIHSLTMLQNKREISPPKKHGSIPL